MTVWALSIATFVLYFIFALSTIFDEAALAGRAAIMRTPAGIMLGGPGYGVENYSAPVAVANEGTMWIVAALSIMSIMHVVKHTREEEESGLAELVRASVVGRHATQIATMITLVIHLAVIAALNTFALALPFKGVAFIDALAMMVACSLIALVFGAAALVLSQITAHARTAIGMSLTAFGAAFAVRAAGDIQGQGGSLLSWFSPIAWAQQIRAFVDLRWWPLLIALATCIALGILAVYLSTRRDFNAGLIAAKPGPAHASPALRSPLMMAWVQQRGVFLWATLGLGITWFATGTLMSTMDEMIAELIETNAVFGLILGNDATIFAAAFLDVIMLFVALCCAAYAVSLGRRPRHEEESGRLELILAAPVCRRDWIGAQLTVSTITSFVMLVVATSALWAGAMLVDMTDPGLGDYAWAILAYTPAVLTFLTLTLALFVWAPACLGLSWALVAIAFVVGMFGPIFNLPSWVFSLSPLNAASTTFTEGADWPGVIVFGVIAALLAIAAFIGFGRREISTA